MLLVHAEEGLLLIKSSKFVSIPPLTSLSILVLIKNQVGSSVAVASSQQLACLQSLHIIQEDIPNTWFIQHSQWE